MTDPDARLEHTQNWLREHRLGLFVHWGVYALAARHEWVRERERMSDADYQRYVDRFEGDLFDADEWMALTRRAGMSFATFTAKHHDGFCLWPSAEGDYTVAHSPFGARDAVREFIDAARRAGVEPGIYYSLLDWHHPEFAIDGFHPLRDDEDARRLRAGADPAVYRRYLHAQVHELLTGYGDLAIGFFDFSYPRDYPHEGGIVWGGKGKDDWGSEELMAAIRTQQPNMLVNDRLDVEGDFVSPEQYQPDAPMQRDGRPVPWMAVQTIDGSWGYDRENRSAKSPDLLVRMLVDTVSKDGSLMINVGPDGRGRITPAHAAILEDVGAWMSLHRRAIDGCTASAFVAPPDARYTQNGRRLYLHLFAWPYGAVHLAGLADRVEYAQLLHDASELATSVSDPDAPAFTIFEGGKPAGTLTVHLPTVRPDVSVPVIELFLKEF